MTRRLDKFFVSPDNSIRETMACINLNTKGVALVVGPGRGLLGVVTDGDIRRAILGGADLDGPVSGVLAGKTGSSYGAPVTAHAGADRGALLQLMRERGVHQMPLLDDDGRVVDLMTREDLVPDEPLGLNAVIMAGGLGSRLRPLTETLPKPMLPVGDRPLMEFIIERLQKAGIRKINVSTHYQSEKIISHFGNGDGFGVRINYVTEDRPMGTAGALGLMEAGDEPLLVINGDILTEVDFKAMLAFHRQHGADITVGVRKYDLQVPYGVVECGGGPYVRAVREKPMLNFLINAGIYLLQPSVLGHIECGRRMDMTDLIRALIQEGRPVASFPIVEYWLDIGRHDDYRKAQEDIKKGALFSNEP